MKVFLDGSLWIGEILVNNRIDEYMFQVMRKCHINDHDPFEPETFVSKNDHYMYEQ